VEKKPKIINIHRIEGYKEEMKEKRKATKESKLIQDKGVSERI
jgi:sRNA-binding carbon storage regulator CsrA